MTARDTHEMRLSSWPKLATFPTTNGFLVLVMLLWLLTGLCALAFAAISFGLVAPGPVPIEKQPVLLVVPEAWYDALKVLTGIVVVQFIGKRGTDVTLWRKPENGGTTPPAVTS